MKLHRQTQWKGLLVVTLLMFSTNIYSQTILTTGSIKARGQDTEEKGTTGLSPSDEQPDTDGEQPKRFSLYSTSSLNSTEEVTKSLTASQKLMAEFLLSDIEFSSNKKDKFSGSTLALSVNLLNLKPTGVSKDSLDLISLMFPETGNAGFMASSKFFFSPLLKYDGDVSRVWGVETSLSLRQTKITNFDSLGTDLGFSVLNYNLSFFYIYEYQKEDLIVNFAISPYFNYFNIPNEDTGNFNQLFSAEAPLFDEVRASQIWSFGVKFSTQVNGFGFFVDLRQNGNTEDIDDANPYKGFVFNAGLITSLSVFKR